MAPITHSDRGMAWTPLAVVTRMSLRSGPSPIATSAPALKSWIHRRREAKRCASGGSREVKTTWALWEQWEELLREEERRPYRRPRKAQVRVVEQVNARVQSADALHQGRWQSPAYQYVDPLHDTPILHGLVYRRFAIGRAGGERPRYAPRSFLTLASTALPLPVIPAATGGAHAGRL